SIRTGPVQSAADGGFCWTCENQIFSPRMVRERGLGLKMTLNACGPKDSGDVLIDAGTLLTEFSPLPRCVLFTRAPTSRRRNADASRQPCALRPAAGRPSRRSSRRAAPDGLAHRVPACAARA